ncbi:MAG: response regulator [Candidatus Omnitrophica bacterium]|nr:response regulator [Candidatus Omnitrophota bacterium]
MKLKGMNGLETLQEIRKTHPGLPVVMITGFGFDEELIYKSKQLGCCGYIGKNIPMAKIISTFKQFVKEAKTRDAQ